MFIPTWAIVLLIVFFMPAWMWLLAFGLGAIAGVLFLVAAYWDSITGPLFFAFLGMGIIGAIFSLIETTFKALQDKWRARRESNSRHHPKC